MTRPKITLRPTTTVRASGKDISVGEVFCHDARTAPVWMMRTGAESIRGTFVAVLLSSGNCIQCREEDRYDIPNSVEIIVEYSK